MCPAELFRLLALEAISPCPGLPRARRLGGPVPGTRSQEDRDPEAVSVVGGRADDRVAPVREFPQRGDSESRCPAGNAGFNEAPVHVARRMPGRASSTRMTGWGVDDGLNGNAVPCPRVVRCGEDVRDGAFERRSEEKLLTVYAAGQHFV